MSSERALEKFITACFVESLLRDTISPIGHTGRPQPCFYASSHVILCVPCLTEPRSRYLMQSYLIYWLANNLILIRNGWKRWPRPVRTGYWNSDCSIFRAERSRGRIWVMVSIMGHKEARSCVREPGRLWKADSRGGGHREIAQKKWIPWCGAERQSEGCFHYWWLPTWVSWLLEMNLGFCP